MASAPSSAPSSPPVSQARPRSPNHLLSLPPSPALSASSALPAIAQAVFSDPQAASSDLLAALSRKASTQTLPSGPEPVASTGLPSGGVVSKIKFYGTVRISGGIASRARASITSKRPFLPAPFFGHPQTRRVAQSPTYPSSSVAFPRPESLFSPGQPLFDRLGRSSFSSTASSLGPGDSASRFDPRHSSVSPSARTLSRPPRSPRPSFDSPQSPHDSHSASNPRGPSLALSSQRGSLGTAYVSVGVPSTVVSRSSSSASSLYVPLRIPLVRAPAPFFGPSAQRVARVRERRMIAARDAERAKGGWKALWNNWYYYSDAIADPKRKAKHAEHGQPDHHHTSPYSTGEDDSDDASCYHDVILEHERKKLERKLQKLKQAQPFARSAQSLTTCRSFSETGQQSFSTDGYQWSDSKKTWRFPWFCSSATGSSKEQAQSGRVKLPDPAPGILCHQVPTLCSDTNTPLLVGSSNCANYKSAYQDHGEAATWNPRSSAKDGVYPQCEQEQDDGDSDSKSDVEILFGSVSVKWLNPRWWFWSFKVTCWSLWSGVKAKFDKLFYVDWEHDHHHHETWQDA